MNEKDKKALVDSANPTTLVGLSWINEFIDAMDESTKKKVKREKSSRVFKFGDGEKKQSEGVIIFPCLMGEDLEVKTRPEVSEADPQ